MRPSEALRLHRERARQIVLRHRVRDVRVFGSVLRGEDQEGSDLDVLVDLTEQTTLLDIGAIQVELTELLGVTVDVVTPGALPAELRARVLGEAQPL